MTKGERKIVQAIGLKARRVVVYQDTNRGAKRLVVHWREWENGTRRYRTFPATAPGRVEAIAYAEGVAETLGKPKVAASITLRGLWQAYFELELSQKKPRTQQMYAYRWRTWEIFAGKDSDPNLTTLEQAQRFRVDLAKLRAPNQVKEILRVVKVVYNWGLRMEKLHTNKLVGYRFQFGAHEAALEPPEYTPDEFHRLVASFPEISMRTWRPWAAIVLAGTQGPRIRALLHLRWDQVDLDGARVTWEKQFDKTTKGRTQPLVEDAVHALRTAWTWREIEEYEGPWVFFSEHAKQRDRADRTYERGVYRVQAAHRQLMKAEIRAKVPHLERRGFHGLRKCASGNALEVFGNPKDALDWIGDTDPRRLKEYAKKRDEHQRLVAAGLSGSSGMLSKSYPREMVMAKKPARPFTIHDAAAELDLRTRSVLDLVYAGKLGRARVPTRAERAAHGLPANITILDSRKVRSEIARRARLARQAGGR